MERLPRSIVAFVSLITSTSAPVTTVSAATTEVALVNAFFKRQGLAGRQGAGKDIFAIDSLNITNSHSATKTNRVLVGAVLGHINQLADNDVVSLNVAGDSNLGTGNIQNASRAVIVSCKSNRLILAWGGARNPDLLSRRDRREALKR